MNTLPLTATEVNPAAFELVSFVPETFDSIDFVADDAAYTAHLAWLESESEGYDAVCSGSMPW